MKNPDYTLYHRVSAHSGPAKGLLSEKRDYYL
jgi:hypothetical protein